MIFQDESGDIDTEPSYSCDAELDDKIIGKALSSPLFIQEREEPANRRQAYHSHEESLLPAQSFFAHTSTGRPVYEPSSCQRWKSSREKENERIRILLERQQEQILAEVSTEIQKHEFQSDSDRSIQELNGTIESQRREIDHTNAGDKQLRPDQRLLQEQLSEQNRDVREAHIKSLHEMEELTRVHELRVDESSRRRLIENQARIQELQNEANSMNDSRDFKDVESVRSGLYHVPSQPALLPPYRDPGGMLSRPGRMLSRNDKPPDIWDTDGFSGNVFVNPPASSSSPYPGGFNPWISNVTEDTLPRVTSERQNPDTALDPRCQSEPSAGNSFDPSEGRFSKDFGADQQRLQISDLRFDKFPTPTTSACWNIRFKTEVCTCSQFPTEAMLWIKEVEMVESVDDLKSSRSIRGTPGPNFEWLDARIASALNKIIQNTRFKKKVSLEEMNDHNEDRFLRGRQIAYLNYEYFRVTGANDSVENYADLFTISLRNDGIQEFNSKWDGIWLSMTKIPPDDILEGLYKLRIRVREAQDRIGIVWPGDSSKEIRTWLSQIEDNGKKKYRAEYTN